MRLDGNVVVSVPVDTGGWALLRCLVQGIRSRLLSDFLIPHFKCSHYQPAKLIDANRTGKYS